MRVPRSWLQRPGGGLPASVWFNRIGAAAAVVAIGFVTAAWIFPLRSGANTAPIIDESFLALPSPADGSAPGRSAAIASLSDAYLFTPGRRPFADFEQADPPREVVEAVPVEEPAAETEPVPRESGVRVVRVEAPEDVGGDIQSSFRELVLRAIHSDRSGRLVALIDFRGGPVDAASIRAGEGERFLEPKHPEEQWGVVAVDPSRNRVVIERQGRRLALALFGTGPADLSPVVIAPEGISDDAVASVRVAPDGTVVVEQSPEDVIAELRQEPATDPGGGASITAEDLVELLRAVRDLERYGDRAREEQQRRRDR